LICCGGTASGTTLRAGARLDIASLAYGSAGTASFAPGSDTLTVSEGGHTYSQVLAGTTTGDAFLLGNDGGGGTVISVTVQTIGAGVTSFIDAAMVRTAGQARGPAYPAVW